MIKNTFNLHKWTALCFAALLAAVLIPAHTSAQTHKNVSWKKVLEQENRRVNHQGAASVLGARVGAEVARIRTQNEARRNLQNAFAQMTKENAEKAKANYNRLKTLLAKNPLFQGYELAAPVPADFYQMKEESFSELLVFCNGQATPLQARQYKRGLFFTLQAQKSAGKVFILADVQNKVLSFVYNNPAKLDSDFLSSKWYELNVR